MNRNTQFSIKAGNFPCVCSWWAKVPLVGFFNRWTTYQIQYWVRFWLSQFQESLFQCRWSVAFHIGRVCTLKVMRAHSLNMQKKMLWENKKTTLFSSQDLHLREHLKKYVVATCCLTLHLQISHWEAVLEQNQICNLKQNLHIIWLALFIRVEVWNNVQPLSKAMKQLWTSPQPIVRQLVELPLCMCCFKALERQANLHAHPPELPITSCFMGTTHCSHDLATLTLTVVLFFLDKNCMWSHQCRQHYL